MAEAFERCDPEATIRGYLETGTVYDHGPSAVEDLRAFFRVCARRGLSLVGSW